MLLRHRTRAPPVLPSAHLPRCPEYSTGKHTHVTSHREVVATPQGCRCRMPSLASRRIATREQMGCRLSRHAKGPAAPLQTPAVSRPEGSRGGCGVWGGCWVWGGCGRGGGGGDARRGAFPALGAGGHCPMSVPCLAHGCPVAVCSVADSCTPVVGGARASTREGRCVSALRPCVASRASRRGVAARASHQTQGRCGGGDCERRCGGGDSAGR